MLPEVGDNDNFEKYANQNRPDVQRGINRVEVTIPDEPYWSDLRTVSRNSNYSGRITVEDAASLLTDDQDAIDQFVDMFGDRPRQYRILLWVEDETDPVDLQDFGGMRYLMGIEELADNVEEFELSGNRLDRHLRSGEVPPSHPVQEKVIDDYLHHWV